MLKTVRGFIKGGLVIYVIYKLLNKNNGKFYIGQTCDFEKRINRHLSTLRNNSHHNRYLQRSFIKHGEDAFEISILHKGLTKKEADEIEVNLIETHYDSKLLYNISKKAGGGDLISYHPERNEIVKKISNALSVRWSNYSDETKELYRIRATGSNNYMYGKTHSEEARLKISKANKGRIVSEIERTKMAERMKCRYENEEEVEKARKRMVDRYTNAEERELTGEKTLLVNINKRLNGEFEPYKYTKFDEEYEFMFKGNYYSGIVSCVIDTGYHPKYIKKKLLSEKEIDVMNYLIYDPIEKLITNGGSTGKKVNHTEDTKKKIRDANLIHKKSDITVYLPSGELHKFEHNFEVIEFLGEFQMKESTINNLIKSGEEWSPKKYIHKHLKGLKIIKKPLTVNA